MLKSHIISEDLPTFLLIKLRQSTFLLLLMEMNNKIKLNSTLNKSYFNNFI